MLISLNSLLYDMFTVSCPVLSHFHFRLQSLPNSRKSLPSLHYCRLFQDWAATLDKQRHDCGRRLSEARLRSELPLLRPTRDLTRWNPPTSPLRRRARHEPQREEFFFLKGVVLSCSFSRQNCKCLCMMKRLPT